MRSGHLWCALASAAALMGMMPGHVSAAASKDDLTVHIYDIGQGSCVLVECPDGPPILNDCGTVGGGRPANAAKQIRARLADLRTTYPAPLQVVISHPHRDHFSVLVAKTYKIDPGDIRSLYYAGPFDAFSQNARDWITALSSRLDAAGRLTTCEPDAHVTCFGLNEHALATPRLSCGKAIVDLLTANAFSFNEGRGAARKDVEGGSPNGESAVLRIRYRGVSIVLPGDAEEVTQLYAAENALALQMPLARASVLLVPHHASNEVGSNNDDWVEATSPQVAVVSANKMGNFGHPNCTALQNFDRVTDPARAMAAISAPMTVRCGTDSSHPDNSTTLHHQFIFTETEGDVTVRVSKSGELSVRCEKGSVACKAVQ